MVASEIRRPRPPGARDLRAVAGEFNVKALGAPMDNVSRTLTSLGYTLAQAQSAFPSIADIAVTDELDWAVTQEAVNRAKLLGVSSGRNTLGIPVRIPDGVARWNRPLILPRTGVTPQYAVHLLGNSVRSTTIVGTSAFPTGRAMIEWEATTSPAWYQRIANLRLVLPSVLDTKGIWHKRNATGAVTAQQWPQEWLNLDLEDILIEAQNIYHEVLIHLEVGNRSGTFRRVQGDPSRSDTDGTTHGVYDTLLLRTGTTRDGVAPAYPDEDSVGLGFCQLEQVWSMMRRGGYSRTFEGRIFESTWIGPTFSQGGHYGRGPNYHFINSGLSEIHNIRTEGKGEDAQIRLTNSDTLIFINSGPVVPNNVYPVWQASHAYSVGDIVCDTRWALTATALTSKQSYICTVAGTSGGGEPTWPASGTVVDGGVTWQANGDMVGNGIEVINSHRIRWRGRFGRAGSAPFSNRLIKLLTIDANCTDCVFEDFDAVEASVGGAPTAEIANSAPLGNHVLVAGMGITGALPGTRTRYVSGWHPGYRNKGPIRSITADYTLLAGDEEIRADATGGNIIVTLPALAGSAGKEYFIKRWNSGANTVTVDTPGAETIEGANGKRLDTQYGSIRLRSDGTRWVILSSQGTVTTV